jgi:hypothetical protein
MQYQFLFLRGSVNSYVMYYNIVFVNNFGLSRKQLRFRQWFDVNGFKKE